MPNSQGLCTCDAINKQNRSKLDEVPMLCCFRWFQGFDWEGLRTQSMMPPIVPKVSK